MDDDETRARTNRFRVLEGLPFPGWGEARDRLIGLVGRPRRDAVRGRAVMAVGALGEEVVRRELGVCGVEGVGRRGRVGRSGVGLTGG